MNVLIVRRPSNLFASRLRKASQKEAVAYPRTNGATMQRIVRVWKQHAREFLGDTRLLDNKVCVYFDWWFSSRSYRRKICQQLNMEFTDVGFDHVSQAGGGSSFDATELDGNNQRMDVLNRRDYLLPSERAVLESILRDRELRDLGQRLVASADIDVR